MNRPLQFDLRGLLILTALFAVVLGLCQWYEPIFVLTLAVIPFCLIGEHVLRVSGAPPVEQAYGSRVRRIVALMLCALGSIGIAGYSVSSGAPVVNAPLPLLVILPLFMVQEFRWGAGAPYAFALAWVIPALSFVVLYWPIVRCSRGPLPLRVMLLLSIASALSLGWFIYASDYGVTYHGMSYTMGVAIVNLGLIMALWTLWWRTHRESTFAWRLGTCTLLHYWLFWFAFPWLGELP